MATSRLFIIEYSSVGNPNSEPYLIDPYRFTDAEMEKRMLLYWPIARDFEDGDNLTVCAGSDKITIRAEVTE